MMGGVVSVPLASGVLAGCGSGVDTGGYVLQTLTPEQFELAGAVAERIIPTTDTPGALAARVHEFMDRMLTDWYPPEDAARFVEGLADVNTRSDEAYGKSFARCSAEEQDAVLTGMESDAAGQSGDEAFFPMVKEMTLVGYYTSEIGASQELKYVHTAGRYDGDIPYSEVGRAYS